MLTKFDFVFVLFLVLLWFCCCGCGWGCVDYLWVITSFFSFSLSRSLITPRGRPGMLPPPRNTSVTPLVMNPNLTKPPINTPNNNTHNFNTNFLYWGSCFVFSLLWEGVVGGGV